MALPLNIAARAQSLEPLLQDTITTDGSAFPNFATGNFRSSNQLVWDTPVRHLKRVDLKFWDPLSADELDVVWTSRDGNYKPGPISGEGQLTWRIKGAATYDTRATVARYRGQLVEGRAHGEGEFLHRSGASYRGQWRSGLMDGRGRLQSPEGAEYVGEFRAGKREGYGLFVDRLGSVYEGGFLVDKRNGVGRVQMAGGGGYVAQWLNDVEVSGSRARIPGFRLTPLTLQAQVDDVRISLTVDRRSLVGVPDINPLYYIAENTPEKVRIFPDDAELLDVWLGKTAPSSEARPNNDFEEQNFMGPTVRYGPVPLLLNVENASGQPIGIEGAFLDVAKSVSELRPALELNESFSAQCDRAFESGLEFENFGWSAARSVSATINFVDSNENAVGPSFVQPTADISNIEDIDVRNELMRRGVKVERLERDALKCTSTDTDKCLAEQVASGMFGDLGKAVTLSDDAFFLNLAGTLDYQWTTAEHTSTKGAAKFTTSLVMGHLPFQGECGEGANEFNLGSKPFELRLDTGGYQVALPLSDTIPPGVVSRWRLWLDAPKSSTHDFRLRIQLADGRMVESRPVSLLYFKPRRTGTDMDGKPLPEEPEPDEPGESTDTEP
ncbi:MORN repeat-containing protein [Kaistia algarum]|uniref:hypothetical protein n=1 Tax=Kaistia algarum TaxID=2083279 RepID=UPI0022540A93|nr:hypothetical protein [Kaistia algarum]MCX5512998.1 hypothetical protein [Kaistia algarum]